MARIIRHRPARDRSHRRAMLHAIACAAAWLCTACALLPPTPPLVLPIGPGNPAAALNIYEVTVARHIAEANAARIAPGRPQALLRAVVSVAYWVDRRGNVVASVLYRDNGDRIAIATALGSLKRASPLPPPSGVLLDGSGRVRLIETWLFNDDGRFQLRSIAAPQIGDE